MRTTIELPDVLYRSLKVRASLSGTSVRQVIQTLIEKGLRAPANPTSPTSYDDPPIIISPRGVPIPAVSRNELKRMEEEEDESKHGRFAGR